MLSESCNINELINRMKSLLAISNEQITGIKFSLSKAVLKNFDSEATKKNLMEVF